MKLSSATEMLITHVDYFPLFFLTTRTILTGENVPLLPNFHKWKNSYFICRKMMWHVLQKRRILFLFFFNLMTCTFPIYLNWNTAMKRFIQCWITHFSQLFAGTLNETLYNSVLRKKMVNSPSLNKKFFSLTNFTHDFPELITGSIYFISSPKFWKSSISNLILKF